MRQNRRIFIAKLLRYYLTAVEMLPASGRGVNTGGALPCCPFANITLQIQMQIFTSIDANVYIYKCKFTYANICIFIRMAEGWGGGGASQGRAPAGRQGGALGNCGLQPSQQGQGSTEAVCQQGQHGESPPAMAGLRV